ncbi:hypothetical protein [Mycobacterium attenuatum]|nr:hypothetical protein [Mycobacterium attenuatum]
MPRLSDGALALAEFDEAHDVTDRYASVGEAQSKLGQYRSIDSLVT